MRISIITPVLNNKDHFLNCLNSIREQTHKDVEHIVIDGGSSDGTLDILRNYSCRFISEFDGGIFYGLNKGIRLATGDVVGILHSDDVFADKSVLEEVAGAFESQKTDSVYGNLVYIGRNNKNKIIRYWKSAPYKDGLFRSGWMPAHPTFFVKREIYKKFGVFDTDFRISADYELMIRFLHLNKVSSYFLDRVLVKMSLGGNSNKNLKNLINKNFEDYAIGKKYGFGIRALLNKNIGKLWQFILR